VAPAAYIPDRRDILWLDFEPKKGREVGRYRPALVLSSKAYNRKTGLLICCPISTSIRGGATEVPLSRLDKPAVVAASLVQTLSWRDRRAKKIVKATRREYDETLLRLLPLIGATELINSILERN
jgi:mRNA interferase MazF